jgi:ABC-type multidrug transport system ATPase subunit
MVLLTTHFLDEAEYLSDKIFILKSGIFLLKWKGELYIEGSPQDIKNYLKSGYTLSVRFETEE